MLAPVSDRRRRGAGPSRSGDPARPAIPALAHLGLEARQARVSAVPVGAPPRSPPHHPGENRARLHLRRGQRDHAMRSLSPEDWAEGGALGVAVATPRAARFLPATRCADVETGQADSAVTCLAFKSWRLRKARNPTWRPQRRRVG